MTLSYVMLFMKRLQQGMCTNSYNYKVIVPIFVAVDENFTYIIFVSH